MSVLRKLLVRQKYSVTSGTQQDGYGVKGYSPERFILISVAVLLLMLLGLGRLASLQAGNNTNYRYITEGNSVREIIERAPRGLIVDINDQPLAWNERTFSLIVGVVSLQSGAIDGSIEAASQILDVNIDVSEGMLADPGSQSEVVLATRLDDRQAIRLEQLSAEVPGLRVQTVYERQYVAETAGLGHALGYTGQVQAAELGSYSPIDHIGRDGLELQYDDRLRGVNGRTVVEVNAQGEVQRVVESQPAIPGEDLQLAIDLDLQISLTLSLKKQTKEAGSQAAAAVITDPRDGAVRAMASLPTYNNQLFDVSSSDESYITKTLKDPLEPLLNRAIGAGYSSGSVIKPVVAVAALQEGVVDEDTVIVDSGELVVASQFDPSVTFTFRGWRPEGLGPMNVRSAIAMSSNIYFYTVAGGHEGIEGLGADLLTDYYSDFGLGKLSGIDLPGEFAGRVPTPDWKREQFDQEWFLGDTYNISIGQGDLLVSPLQILLANQTVTNNGSYIAPSLLQQADDQIQTRQVSGSDYVYRVVQEGMRQVVTSGTTSQSTFAEVGVDVAGKSGTAETNTPDGRDPHAWYVAYAPYEAPELVGAVIIEEGVGGSSYAAPVLAEAFETFFSQAETEPVQQ